MIARLITWIVIGLTLLLIAPGCNLPPQRAAFVQSSMFEPANVEAIALRLGSGDGRQMRPEAMVAESAFVSALMERGYHVLRANAGAGNSRQALPLVVGIDSPGAMREVREGIETTYRNKRKYERVVHRTYYVARATVRGEMTGADGAIVWSSSHSSIMESEQSPEAAQQAAVESAAGMVAASLPYRVLPLDKNNRPYDPRIQKP